MGYFQLKNEVDNCTKNVQLLRTQFSNKIFGEIDNSEIWQTRNNSLDFSPLFHIRNWNHSNIVVKTFISKFNP